MRRTRGSPSISSGVAPPTPCTSSSRASCGSGRAPGGEGGEGGEGGDAGEGGGTGGGTRVGPTPLVSLSGVSGTPSVSGVRAGGVVSAVSTEVPLFPRCQTARCGAVRCLQDSPFSAGAHLSSPGCGQAVGWVARRAGRAGGRVRGGTHRSRLCRFPRPPKPHPAPPPTPAVSASCEDEGTVIAGGGRRRAARASESGGRDGPG